MGCLRLIIKVWFLSLCLGLACYYFLDDAEDAMQKTSYLDVLDIEMKLTRESDSDIERRKDTVKSIKKEIKAKYGIDVSKSIMDTIKEKQFKYAVSEGKKINGVVIFNVAFNDNKGNKGIISFACSDKSIHEASWAMMQLTDYKGKMVSKYPSSNIAYFIYGIDLKAIPHLDRIHPFYGKD